MSERLFTILVTGTLNLQKSFLDALPGHISVEVVPFIRIEKLSDEKITSRISELSRSSINAVFTSAEAVRAVRSVTAEPLAWNGWCTSGPTQTELRDWLGGAAPVTAAPDALTLAEKLIFARQSEAIFFCGNQRRDVLPDRLKAAGLKVEELIVYNTIATPVHLEQEFDAILFFSPSAVESFLSLNRIAGKTAVFALGTTTTEALRKRITHTVMISSQPDKNFLLQTAIDHAQAHQTL